MKLFDDATAAAGALRAGAVLAYPTEAVWGLGCDPRNADAVARLLAAKNRPQEKGLILIAATVAQLDDFVDWAALDAGQRQTVLASWPAPCTWVLPASRTVPRWLTGQYDGIAARVSAHPPVQALCRAFGALISTSANISGQPAVRQQQALDAQLLAKIDGLFVGQTGDLQRPTPIFDARSGQQLRR